MMDGEELLAQGASIEEQLMKGARAFRKRGAGGKFSRRRSGDQDASAASLSERSDSSSRSSSAFGARATRRWTRSRRVEKVGGKGARPSAKVIKQQQERKEKRKLAGPSVSPGGFYWPPSKPPVVAATLSDVVAAAEGAFQPASLSEIVTSGAAGRKSATAAASAAAAAAASASESSDEEDEKDGYDEDSDNDDSDDDSDEDQEGAFGWPADELESSSEMHQGLLASSAASDLPADPSRESESEGVFVASDDEAEAHRREVRALSETIRSLTSEPKRPAWGAGAVAGGGHAHSGLGSRVRVGSFQSVDTAGSARSSVDEHGNSRPKAPRVKDSTRKRRLKIACKRAVRDWVMAAQPDLSLRNRGLYGISGLNKIVRDSELVSRLTGLDLSRNKLRRVPRHALAMNHLVELRLDYNRLTELSFMDMSSLSSLAVLSASHNRIRCFPEALATLPALEHLELRDNLIESLLPADDERRRAFVSSLGSTLGRSLKALDLGMNSLSGKLDHRFFEALLKIEQLSIHTNSISALPACFKHMERLRVLRATGNPLQMPPPSVVKSGPESVRAFFRSLEKGAARRLNPGSAAVEVPSEGEDSVDVPVNAAAAAQSERSASPVTAGDAVPAISSPQSPSRTSLARPAAAAGSSQLVGIAESAEDDDPDLSWDSDEEATARAAAAASVANGESTAGDFEECSASPRRGGKEDSDTRKQGPAAGSVAAAKTAARIATEAPSAVASSSSISSVTIRSVIHDGNGCSEDGEGGGGGGGETAGEHSPRAASEGASGSEAAPAPAKSNSAGAGAGSNSAQHNFKIVVLGHESAGKTSLIRSLVKGGRMITDEDARTFGVDIYRCELEAAAASGAVVDSQLLTIWDFAGQSVYYRSHQLFLSRRTLYLVLWDITKCAVAELDAEVCFWIYSVQARVPGAVIQIIASKTDCVTPEQARERIELLRRRLAQHETWQKNDLQAMIYEEEHDAHGGGGGGGDLCSTMSIVSGISGARKAWTAAESAIAESVASYQIGEEDDLLKDIDDDEYHDMRPQVLLRQRPNVLSDILAVSSRAYTGFDTLRDTLLRLVRDDSLFPHVGTLACIPSTWAVVEDAVGELRCERKAQPVCSWEDLEQRVRELEARTGVVVPQEDMQQCILFLNDIGDIVHNRTTTNLLFLDSEWIVNCIKRVVDHNLVQKLSRRTRSERMKSRGAILKGESVVARDVSHLTEKGVLCERLVERLWPELFKTDRRGKRWVKSRQVYEGVLNVLEQFDVCSPLPSAEAGVRRWLIPCLITQSIDLDKCWPKLSGSMEQPALLEVGVCFVFTRFRPPGMMCKVFTRISELFDTRNAETRTWQNASIIRLRVAERRHIRLLLCLQQEKVYGAAHEEDGGSDGGSDGEDSSSFDHERAVLNLSARGHQADLLEMWEHLGMLKEMIETILIDEYVGITWVYMVRCPVCLSMLQRGDPTSAAHSFQLLDLEHTAKSFEEDLLQDWRDFVGGVMPPMVGLERQATGSSATSGGSHMSPTPSRPALCTIMCEARAAHITDHDCPLMWLLPPPCSRESLRQLEPNEPAFRVDSVPAGGVSARDVAADGAAFGQEPPVAAARGAAREASAELRLHEMRLWSGTIFDARSICRIGVYCALAKKFEEQGTGFVIDREKGLIVSACHLISDPSTRARKFDLGPHSTKRMIIGCFEREDTIPPWRYEAEIVLAGNGQSTSSSFLDVMILRVTHRVTEVSHSPNHPASSIFGRMVIQRSDGTGLPLPAEIRIGDSNNVRIGDAVSLVGYPLRRGETICMDNGFTVGFSPRKAFIHATPWNHDGSSGGPLLNSEGAVIGVMSKSTSGDLGVHLATSRLVPLLRPLYAEMMKQTSQDS